MVGVFFTFLMATRLKTKCQMPVKYPRGGGGCMDGLGVPFKSFKLMSSGKQQREMDVYTEITYLFLTKQMATTIWCT